MKLLTEKLLTKIAISIMLLATCTIWAQGHETFSNIGNSNSSYLTRTWTGDDGISWEATEARTDQDINGDAISYRGGGRLINTSTISGGVGTLSFQYARVFSNSSTVRVYVNDVQYGDDLIVSSTAPNTFSTAVNVTGNVEIRYERRYV